jgi:WS/DGAT/MGAT family acyltransferase
MSDVLPQRLSYEDAAFLTFDRPEFPYNVGSVGIYEGVIPFQRYIAHVERRLDAVPRYRQRLCHAPLNIAHPAWQDDPHFEISRHVEEVTLPAPGDEAALRRVAGDFLAKPLDRNKPLWEIGLVQGLSGGRTAHIAKIHHCLVDGIAGAQLLAALLDTEPSPPEKLLGDAWSRPEALPGPLESLIDASFDQLGNFTSTAEALTLAAIDPGPATSAARSIARSLRAALPHLFRTGKMPWATRLQGPSRLAWSRLPFERVETVGHMLRGTVNDVVLTVLSGALQHYLQFHSQPIPDQAVRVLIPVNVRAEREQRSLGNRVSFMLAGLPVALRDPLERFRAIHNEIASLKDLDQAGNLDKLGGLIGRMPPAVQHRLAAELRVPNFVYDLVCTNVPGPRSPLYCLGHRMIEHYPWVPIGWRMGLGVAVMSYNAELCFSFTADRGVLKDVERLGEYVRDSFGELEDAVCDAAGPGLAAVLTGPENGAAPPERTREERAHLESN